MRRPGATLFLAALLATSLATTSSVEATQKFQIDMGNNTYLVGTFALTNEHEPYVDITWLLNGANKTFIPVGGVEGFNVYGFSSLLESGGGAFDVVQLTSDFRLMFGYPIGYAGPPEPPFESFFALMRRNQDMHWSTKTYVPFAWIDEWAEAATMGSDPLGEEGGGENICLESEPQPDEQRFDLVLTPEMRMVVIVHSDGSVEIRIYLKDVDGCWVLWDLPSIGEEPGDDQLADPVDPPVHPPSDPPTDPPGG